jgi:putative transposase
MQWSKDQAAVAPELLIQLLVRAAAEMRSLSAIVAEAGAAPCYETVRISLLALLPEEPMDLLPATTRALQARLPKALARRPRSAAIDLYLRPYYGDKKTRGIYRGQPKASTKNFFAYATLLIIRRGQTYTVGLTHVVNGEEQTALIDRLLQQAARAGIRIKRLLLDRGFYAATTMLWLQQRAISFIMPMIRRGKAARRKADCTGTECFFVHGRRGWDQYTWIARPRRRGHKQAAVTVTIDVCMTPRSQSVSRTKPKKKTPLVYACHGVHANPKQVMTWYRRRFRIETSYRQLGEGLAMTCSKNPVYRLLLVTIALVLRNMWVWIHGRHLATTTSEGRQRNLERLPLRRLTSWLIHALNKLLGFRPRVANSD